MKKLVIIVSILAVVGLLGFAAYKIFLAAKVPQAFIDGHNKIADLGKEAENLTNPDNIPDFGKMVSDKDYKGAIKALDDTLAKENQALQKVKDIDSELAKLKVLLNEITDAKAKEASIRRIDLGEKENAAKTKYIALRIQVLEKTREMIKVIDKDESLFTSADEKAVNALADQIGQLKDQAEKANNELVDIQNQYKTVEKEFMKATNLSVI
jgi:hypothetical protein